jgi:uncharacterized protein (DUF58 family)
MFRLLRRRSRGDDAPPVGAAAGSAAAIPTNIDAEAFLRRLEWTVLRRLDGILQGDYRTLFRGFGLDLADLREYQPHDDVRHIDWNVTARMQTPYVREFQEDREIAAWFLVDLSGSIDFGSNRTRKRALAMELVGTLARILTRHGNRVGVILYSENAETMIPARAGRRHVLHVLDSMAKVRRPKLGTETDLNLLITKAHGTIKRRSVIFLLSDFLSKPGWPNGLAQLTRRHEVVAVRLYDPLEVAMPNLGLVVLQDAETGEQMFVDTNDKSFRNRFAKSAEQREADLRRAFVEAGVDCLELATDDSVDEALLRFMRLRKQRSRLSAGASMTTVVAA